MKVKTSITLLEETIRAIDALAGDQFNRSQIIEQAIAYFLAARARAERDERDRDTLDRIVDELNEEVADALRFQVDL